MAVFNLGSINIDHIYSLDHFPQPGETLAATGYQRLPGGKGANQSVALAAAGAEVFHIGALHRDDQWLVDFLKARGVDLSHIQTGETPSGHAIVMVDGNGENQIILYPGANAEIDITAAQQELRHGGAGDWALLQNETNGGAEFVKSARKAGMKIAYSAAPFEPGVTLALLPEVDLLIVNAIEAEALIEATGGDAESLGVDHLVITRGGDGAEYIGIEGHHRQSAPAVSVVDTTGAGDCFFGYFLATLAGGGMVEAALSRAIAASAIQVTRPGASHAIPTADEVASFLGKET